MLEKIKKISNPLTIVAIFAALAEVSATTVFPFLDIELQRTFIWFVIFFPILLVILFFITLNFNPKVMYAPSDFKDEKNFISTLSGFATNVQQISITKDNLKDYNENLEKIDSEVRNKLEILQPTKEVILFANSLFKHLLIKIEVFLKKKLINSILYSMESPNHFLLSVRFSPELTHNNIEVSTNFIMHFRNENEKIFLEIFGKDISGYKSDIIADRLFNYINTQIESMKKNKHVFGQ